MGAATGAACFSSNGREVRYPLAYSSAVSSYRTQGSSNPTHLYHYTSTSSAEAIRSSGKIEASTRAGDCALGEGVYFTSKAPVCSKSSLLENNYGNACADSSRVESYVKVDANKVNATSGKDRLGRDVYVVKGDVDLASAGASVRKRK